MNNPVIKSTYYLIEYDAVQSVESQPTFLEEYIASIFRVE
jgi:hypothetical protein